MTSLLQEKTIYVHMYNYECDNGERDRARGYSVDEECPRMSVDEEYCPRVL